MKAAWVHYTTVYRYTYAEILSCARCGKNKKGFSVDTSSKKEEEGVLGGKKVERLFSRMCSSSSTFVLCVVFNKVLLSGFSVHYTQAFLFILLRSTIVHRSGIKIK